MQVPNMPRTKTILEESILRVLSARPAGARISSFEKATTSAGTKVSRSTLQRCLVRMEKTSAILREGRSVAATFALPRAETHFDLSSLKLSKKAAEIREAVSLPAIVKNPVFWNRSFRESYEPNETCFLDRATRVQLLNMGQTGPDRLPAGT